MSNRYRDIHPFDSKANGTSNTTTNSLDILNQTPITPPPSIGVTIIAGFLGSGKSTLVRRILTENHGLRILVVENEFGDRVSSSIETAVITAVQLPPPSTSHPDQTTGNHTNDHNTKEDRSSSPNTLAHLIQLPNGCICCAASDHLADSLTRLLRSDNAPPFDHVVIEASGLADPAPVAAAFWLDEQLESRLTLDGIVTIVDAPLLHHYLHQQPPRSDPSSNLADNKHSLPSPIQSASKQTTRTDSARLAEKQIAVADAVLLNKIDLLCLTSSHEHSQHHPQALELQPPEQKQQQQCPNDTHLNSVRAIVASLKPSGTPVFETIRCDAPLAQLLHLRAYDRSRVDNLISTASLFTEHVVHPQGVGAISFTIPDARFDAYLLDRAFGELLWGNQQENVQTGDVWRAKALVALEDEPHKVLYQAVHTLFEGEPTTLEWNESEPLVSSFVFIGRHLEKSHLISVISKAIVTPSTTNQPIST